MVNAILSTRLRLKGFDHMRLRLRWAAAGLSALIVTTTGLVAVGSSAFAVTPPYEPDPTSSGSISFYDASGGVVTSGSITAHPFVSFAASSKAARTGDFKATLFAYTPKLGTPTGAFPGETMTASTAFPNATAPAPVKNFTVPVASATAADFSLSDYIADFPNTATDAYQGLYQLRLKTSGPVGFDTAYVSTSIMVTGTTWTQVYPVPATPTTTATALAVTPAGPVAAGTSVQLKATVTPTAAGTVQFLDGVTNLGPAVAVAAGQATFTTTGLASGTHSLTAKFTPTDATAFTGSTSAAMSFVVNASATTTTAAIAVTPVSPVVVGTSTTLTATITPGTAIGSVQFLDGATNLGSPVAVAGGSAVFTTAALTVATHSLTAKFIPTNAANFATSTSTASSYTVTSVPATVTTTALVAAPSGAAVFGSTVTLTSTTTPSTAPGTVQFFDGVTAIGGPVAVASGTAIRTTTTLATGAHTLKATFTATSAALFTPSTSTTVAYSITAAPATPTTTTVSATPLSPVTFGTSVAIKATVAPTTAVGTVQFLDGATALGAPVAVASGSATFTTAGLTVATHSLTATFTPTVPANFVGSTSAAVSYVVNPAPPGATTTTLVVTPAGPVVLGSSVSLKAAIAPTAAAGTVQLFDGATAIGGPVTVAAGSATYSTTTLAVGSHALSATFTPGTATYLGSTSAAKTLVVNPPPVATTTTLAVSPVGPVIQGASVLLTATVAPGTAAGSVQFLDGTKLLGTAVVSVGTATLTTTALSAGTHSLTAKFVPTNVASFATSISAATSFVVQPKPATVTTTVLAVSPTSPVGAGKPVTLKATVSPVTAAGSVRFYDGTKLLGTVAVVSGKASLTLSTLAVGQHSLAAVFVPSSAALFTTSTSAAVGYTIKKAAVLVVRNAKGQVVTSGSTLTPGAKLTLTGNGFAPDEVVSITVHSTTFDLGSATADSTGAVTASVTLPTSLLASTHVVTLSSASNQVTFSFTVAAAPVGSGTGSGTGSGSGNGLPHTGGDSMPVGLGALALIGAGALIVTVARRRKGLEAA